MKILAAVCVAIVIIGILALAWVWSGFYNVAAGRPDTAVEKWFFSHVMDHSVRYHARKVKVPDLTVPSMQQSGYRQFRLMCAECHGAPGTEPSEIGSGLIPYPPDLGDAVRDWKPGQLFWIVDNGIRMTGMPSFGASVSDAELWNIVSFIGLLPAMSPKQYENFAADTTRHE
jgi:mono/diheme cytochrome c family protein